MALNCFFQNLFKIQRKFVKKHGISWKMLMKKYQISLFMNKHLYDNAEITVSRMFIGAVKNTWLSQD